jgi:hypothetical protein
MLSFNITINVIENHFGDFALLIYYIINLVEVKSNSLLSRKRCEDYGWLWKPKYSKVFNGKLYRAQRDKNPTIDLLGFGNILSSS